MNFKKIFQILNKKDNSFISLVKVHSHPRSGTHFLEAFLAQNFYKDLNLAEDEVAWGHWSDRRINTSGNPYGKLFGNHYFPDLNKDCSPKLYIYRDGRAVAYSFWRTENFLNKSQSNLAFEEFLNCKMDWYGTPSNKASNNFTLLEHWAKHVSSWEQFAIRNRNVCLVKYEDLVKNPYEVYLKIFECYFSYLKLKQMDEVIYINDPVGILPNEARTDSWKGKFPNEELNKYQALLKEYNINHLFYEN